MSLTDQQLDGFRERLLQLQQELQALRHTGAAAAQVVELDQTSVGRLSRMDALQGQAMSQAQGRRRAAEQQKIAAALRRLAAGEYGCCLACDAAIAVARLQLDPAVTLCIACAEQRENSSGAAHN